MSFIIQYPPFKFTPLFSLFVLVFVVVSGLFVSFSLSDNSTKPQLSKNFFRFQEETPSPEPEKPYRILFGGDLMFDRHIRQSMEKNGVDFVLAPLKETLLSYDMVVANLEGSITPDRSVSVNTAVNVPAHFNFTFDPAVAAMLQKHNITMVSLANNHIRNRGARGVNLTKQYLSEANISYFGNTGEEARSEERIRIFEHKGKKFAFVGVNQFLDDGFSVGKEDVQYARQHADTVIVMPHWGNEYHTQSGEVIQEYAHSLIDAGADLIIGAHPHVIQQTEVYKDKTIYYSLGNFVFDQYFEEMTRKGLLVGVEFYSNGSLKFTEIPIYLLPSGQTQLREKR